MMDLTKEEEEALKEEEEEEVAEVKEPDAEEPDAEEPDAEEPVEYEIKSVFSGEDRIDQVYKAMEMNQKAYDELSAQLEKGDISEEEFNEQAGQIKSAITRAQVHIDAIQAYRNESFQHQVEDYCNAHMAVKQTRAIYNAFSGTANHIHDEMVARGERPSIVQVLDLARQSVENDFRVDLSGDRVRYNREEAKKAKAPKTPEQAVKEVKAKAKEVPPDLGKYAPAQNEDDKTRFQLLDDLAGSDTEKYVAEMAKLSEAELTSYLRYMPEA